MACFFKVLLGDWEKKLRIPTLFVSCFSELTPKTIILIHPVSKRLWTVDIEEDDDRDLYFTRGWAKFVTENALATGEFLFFMFDGNSKFQVWICGKSACEKTLENLALEALVNQKNHKQRHNKQTATRHGQETRKGKDPMDVERQMGKLVDAEIKEERIDFDDSSTSRQETCDETWVPDSEAEEEELEEEEEEDYEAEEESGESEALQPEPRDPTRNIGGDRNLGCKVPSFSIHLQRAYAKQGCMCIPTEFFKKYIRKEMQEVEIETVRGVWTVTLLPFKKRTRTFARFSKGWSQFAKKNHLKEGQTLIFKMIRGGHCPKFIVYRQEKTIK
ncbi:B3 domain-containing transcription factor VRN1-like [Prosopis cineraria]|uniref:B3 domain-containing transcription factor VRN1-like n=1 Tax=Prosopis cineraria TaxID=364024 RepID=UPI0024106550|nr:B3 domain-containing transcription factor VRN1-like [Prosopis cineraria]